jgi:hypothetical protein
MPIVMVLYINPDICCNLPAAGGSGKDKDWLQVTTCKIDLDNSFSRIAAA